ncbi:DUF6401 family natural product biosynthesis protein [Streptomonospora nanhaiensis]|uniref:Uncharacterized protein n=1 Tax=Streptomonospora nanhaiensis TaxID=1323731 RepID=A0A853BRY6_9ACTN|nr:DUF6401 family natural product biosynthesis protein [Streptomonospora nanhaiensis]MBV2362748.1 hypothetical protein [Streptomonospora nanhaiensis]MBX9389780.1 hypothetical protein [Streptomonospora nanhaiensis]NYI97903.1 hypothetical protein [Streptomonospora nanhaiensis]
MRPGFFAEGPLARLSREFGLLGPLSGTTEPWLTAELDQHAAAVRDSLSADGGRITHRSLTRYLHGFIDGCRERGWHSASDGYDWETLRVLAVCRLAKEHGFVR